MTAYREGGSVPAMRRRYLFTSHPRLFAVYVVGFLFALGSAAVWAVDARAASSMGAAVVAALFAAMADRTMTIYERNGAYLDLRRGLSRLRTARLHVDVGAEVAVVAAGIESLTKQRTLLERRLVHLVEITTASGPRTVGESADRARAHELAAGLRIVVGPSPPG